MAADNGEISAFRDKRQRTGCAEGDSDVDLAAVHHVRVGLAAVGEFVGSAGRADEDFAGDVAPFY